MRRILPALAWVSCSIWSTAQPAPAPFADGLARLAALGLPDMTGATWSRPPAPLRETLPTNQLRNYGITLQGTCWQLPGEPPRFLPLGLPTPLDLPAATSTPENPDEKPSLLQRMLQKHAEESPPKEAKPRPGPSLAEDVDRIIQSFADADTLERISDTMQYSPESAFPGQCLLFAAQIHAAGDPATANTLAAALFNALPGQKTEIIDSAITRLADISYQTATASFFKTNDWKSYHATLQQLLETFPRGWSAAPAVAMLMPALEKRATGQLPPTPSIPGIDLNPAALEVLQRLLEPAGPSVTPPSIADFARERGIDLADIPVEHHAQIIAMLQDRAPTTASNLWILTPPDPATPPSTPAAQLQAMGMDGIIALAAIATDDTLIPSRRSRSSGSRSFSFNSSPLEDLQRRFSNLDRPQSRSEFATSLLASTVPTGPDESASGDPSALRDAAINFWKNHRSKSTTELAQVFLTEGSSSQSLQAADFLASSEDPAANQAFESAVLNSENPATLASVVESYLARRKAAAAPFFASFSKLIRESYEGVDLDDFGYSSGAYTIVEAGGVEKYLRNLSLKVGNVSIDKLIADALATQPADEDEDEDEESDSEDSPIASLSVALQSVPIADALKAFARAEPKTTPAQWLEILELLANHLQEIDGEPITLPQPVIELWLPLLAKTDPIPPDSDFFEFAGDYGAKTLGEGTALILEMAAFPGTSGTNFYDFVTFSGGWQNVAPFVISRVNAWTKGESPPPWPDYEKVPEARQSELTTQLEKLPAPEILPFIRSLTLDERAFILDFPFDEESPPPASLIDLRDTIVAIGADYPSRPHDDAIAKSLGITTGTRITPEFITGLVESLLSDSATHSGTSIDITTGPFDLGTRIATHRTPIPDPEGYPFSHVDYLAEYHDPDPAADAIALCYVGEENSVWMRKEGKITVTTENHPAIAELKKHLESKDLDAATILICVLSREDVEKINNSN